MNNFTSVLAGLVLAGALVILAACALHTMARNATAALRLERTERAIAANPVPDRVPDAWLDTPSLH